MAFENVVCINNLFILHEIEQCSEDYAGIS